MVYFIFMSYNDWLVLHVPFNQLHKGGTVSQLAEHRGPAMQLQPLLWLLLCFSCYDMFNVCCDFFVLIWLNIYL